MTDNKVKAKEILKTAGVKAYDVKLSFIIDEAEAKKIGIDTPQLVQAYIEDLMVEGGMPLEHIEAAISDLDDM